MPPPPELPGPLAARAPTRDDIEAVVELLAACERADAGAALINRQEVEADWERPHFELAADALLVLDGDRVVAEAEVGGKRADVDVHPDARGRGIGAALLRWAERRAREKGVDVLSQTVPAGARGATSLLEANGYAGAFTSWVLAIELAERPLQPDVPASVTLRQFRPPDEERAVYRVVEDAFSEWDHRDPTPFEDWAGYTIRRPDFDPSLLHVAVVDGQIVGACVGFDFPDQGDLWIGQLAVDAAHRGRGIGGALLRNAFAAAWERGRGTCLLSTDSRTGALSLYERAGMRVQSSWTNYRTQL